MKRKPEALLESWTVIKDGFGNEYLHGQFFGHPRQDNCPDGAWGTTTALVQFDPNAGFAETRNTMYSLGKRMETH